MQSTRRVRCDKHCLFVNDRINLRILVIACQHVLNTSNEEPTLLCDRRSVI
jgi:hypothetical protein